MEQHLSAEVTAESAPRNVDRPEGVSAIIVHYRNLDETCAQISRVRAWADEVVVVANDGSSAQSLPAEIQQEEITWLRPASNLGYGGAVNAALPRCTYATVAVLNPDVQLDPLAALEAIAIAREPNVGVVGFGMRDADGAFLSGAGQWDPRSGRKRMTPLRTSRQECDWVTGAAMFFPAQVAEQVRFDERYFLGIEDLDFCLRAADAGRRVVVLDGRSTTHVGGTSVGTVRWYYYAFRNPIWLVESRIGHRAAVHLRLKTAALTVKTAMVDAAKRRGFSRSRMMARALRDSRRFKPTPMARPYEWEPVNVP